VPSHGKAITRVLNVRSHYISVSVLLGGVRQCSWTSESWD